MSELFDLQRGLFAFLTFLVCGSLCDPPDRVLYGVVEIFSSSLEWIWL